MLTNKTDSVFAMLMAFSGKTDDELIAETDGLFEVDVARLRAVNEVDEVMIATRRSHTAVHPGDKLAGMRVIPLVIAEEKLARAKAAAGDAPLMRLLPWKRMFLCYETVLIHD